MDFFGISRISNWLGGFGNDRFTRTRNKWHRNEITGNEKEQYVTINGHEAELYRTTAELKIVLDRFASMFSNGIYQEIDKNGKIVENSEAVKRLNNPNPIHTGKTFMQEQVLHYFIFGNRLTYTNYGSALSEVPSAMYNLPPNRLKAELTGMLYEQTTIEGIIERWCLEYLDKTSNKQNKYFDPSEIIHHKLVDPENPIMGRSVLECLQMVLSNIRASYAFQNVHLTKKGSIGMYVNKGQDVAGRIPVTTEERLKIEKQETEEYGIFEGQSAIKFIDANVDFVSTSYPIKDAMLFETMSEGMKKIIDAVQLNDNIFSKEKSKVQANLNEGIKMAYNDAIIPFANDVCEGYNKNFRLKEGNQIICSYAHISALQKDGLTDARIQQVRSQAIKSLVDAGVPLKDAIEQVDNPTI